MFGGSRDPVDLRASLCFPQPWGGVSKMKLWFALLATALIASCSIGFQPYPQIAGGGSADLHAARDASEGSSLGTPPAHWFFAYDNDDCVLTERGGFLGAISWDVGNEFDTRLQADQPVYLRAISRHAALSAPGELSRIYCISVAGFVPRAGASYRVSQNALSSDCSVRIIDVTTGHAPADLRIVRVEGPCATFNGRNDGESAVAAKP